MVLLPNWVKRFNRWYDGLQEPWRMLIYVVPITLSIFAINKSVEKILNAPWLFIPGVVLLSIMIAWGISRYLMHYSD